MMNSAARLLTRRYAVAARRLPVVRTFAAAPVTSQAEEHNLVRQSIQRLLDHYQQELPSSSGSSSTTKRNITDEVLEKAVQACQNQAEEARLCIADCQEATIEELAEEFRTADLAMEEAVAALVDLLDGLRHASDSQQQRYVTCREEYASKIKGLRQTLEDLKVTATV